MSALAKSIHGQQQFMDLEIMFNYIDVFVFFSYFYVAVTFAMVCNMCRLYYGSKVFNKAKMVHPSLFRSFLGMQIANFSFFVSDNLVFRLPSTGLLTSTCASMSPSHFLKVLYMLQLLTSYCTMFYAMLFCATRLIVVFFPKRHQKIWSRMFGISVPLTFILPLIADFYMFPALGYCKQLTDPYPYGAISVSFMGSWFDIRTDRCMLYLSFITPTIIILANGVLIYKVRALLFHSKKNRSQMSRRAQMSLTLTTLAISIQFLASGGKTAIGLMDASYAPYALFVRNPLMDFGMVLVPWIFYLSHPMFHERSGAVSVVR